MVNKKILLISIIIIVIISLGVGAFIFFNPLETIPAEENITIPVFQDPNCTREFSPKFNAAPYYNGPLFDTHFHMPPTFRHEGEGALFPILEKNITLNEIVCQLEEEKVIGTFAFYFPNFWMLMNESKTFGEISNKWGDEIHMIKRGAPEWMHLFFTPGPMQPEEIRAVYNSNSDVFEGFGEIVYFFPAAPRMFSKPDDKISLGIYDIADENNLIVMLHPSLRQRGNLENALKEYPHVRFVLHGWEHLGYLWELMEKYPNLYFTVDGATLYPIQGTINGPKEKFLATFKEDFNSLLETDASYWKQIIERFPDRFMWGTDKSVDFHYTEEMSLLQEEFSRAFIGRLDPAVQEKFAYKNAENLLKN